MSWNGGTAVLFLRVGLCGFFCIFAPQIAYVKMNKILHIAAVLTALFFAFSCSEKELQTDEPPQQENPSDTEPEQPGDTGGTEDSGSTDEPPVAQNPDEVEFFEIRTAEDLVALAASVNAGTSKVKTAMLMNDIDMSSVTSWTPIGYANCPVGGG